MEHGEDAGVYKISDDLAIIQTVDFFTPIVDDPYTFGQIAVANALSDVYAMGGRPVTAMNIVCFPVKKMDMGILRQILRGGLDKMREADVLLIGGHSVEDSELKYGLSVAGLVHPGRVLFNRGAKPGDKLILTKPLGTGIVSTALKAGLAGEDLVNKSVLSMTTLNRKAAEIIRNVTDINACTDITGFGLIGHAAEMIEESDTGIVIDSSSVPFFPGIREFAETGIVPGGLNRNRSFREGIVDAGPSCPGWMLDILFDPQTSGGLFMSVPAQHIGRLLDRMHDEGITEAAIVGDVVAKPKGIITVI
jgi:selenide,water dikinase